ncbi:MAG: MarR family winged helix-turn-helix transcriptional regulator [Acidimicrobiales bacterium]
MEDEVEHLVAGWRRALPDIDVAPLEVLSRVTRLAQHLERQRSVVFARHDLETWTFDVLSALRRAGPPHDLSPGQLLAHTLVTSGTMTNRLNHLEQRGLVRRRPDSRDARSVRVRLTAAGRKKVEGALEDLVVREDALLGSLDADRRSELAALLKIVVAPLDSSGAK